MTSRPVLRVSSLEVSFGPVPVLTEVDLEVAEGSFTAVLGASGSGKTTLLRTVAGFERPDTGTIELAGQTVDGPGRHVPPERRRLGYVPQEGALFPHLTVNGNVGFGLARRARTPGRLSALLDLVGLDGLGRRFPHELSGGQQQRVALARALALEPALILLDEPFASLDAALRMSVRSDIARVLRDAGATVVLVTHDQQEAMSLADQVAVLRGGRIAQVGAPHDLYVRPVDPDMARFVGEANLVSAVLRGGDAVTALGTLRTGPVAFTEGVALIRPEQVTVADAGADGLPGEVVEQAYHGHDSMLTVRPLRECGSGLLRVRVSGSARFPTGTRVTLSASGWAPSWPSPVATPVVPLFEALSSFDPPSELLEPGSVRTPQDPDPGIVSALQTPNGRLTANQSVELVAAYQAGASAKELSKSYGLSPRAVRAHIHRSGISLRPKRKLTNEQSKELVQLYSQGWIAADLATRFHCSGRTIFLELKRAGVAPRPRGRLR